MAKKNAGREIQVDPRIKYGLTPFAMDAFIERAKVTNLSHFLDPTKPDRYVLISVDPAGGGFLSEEAFIIWIISQGAFALLSGRTVRGHKAGYAFSTVPLMFVVSLLETIRQVQKALRQLHANASIPGEFQMPKVIVLIETDYAYGAAVYMQTLFFLEEQRKRLPDLRDVVIVFATPVYLWNVPIASKMDELKREQQRKEIIRANYAKAQVNLTDAWNGRPLRDGIELEDEFDKKAVAYLRVEEMVQNAVNDMIETFKKQQAEKDGKGKKSAEQIEEFENYIKTTMAPLFVQEQELRRSVQVNTKTISKLNAELKDLLNEGIPTPGGRDFFRAKPWPDGLKVVNDIVVL